MRLSVLGDSPFYGGRLCMFAQVTLNGEPVRWCQEFDEEEGWVRVLAAGPNGGTVIEYEAEDGHWISEYDPELAMADRMRLTGESRMRTEVRHGSVAVAFPDLAPESLSTMIARIGDGAREDDQVRRVERDALWRTEVAQENPEHRERAEQARAEREARISAAARAGHVLGDDAP